MAPPHETPTLHWTKRCLASFDASEPQRNDSSEHSEGNSGEESPAESAQHESTRERIVPRTRCQECTDRPEVHGLCIACFME